MAVIDSIRNFFAPPFLADEEVVISAEPTTYTILPLTVENLPEVLRLNIRCFRNGDNYTKYTFEYLFDEPRTLGYRVITGASEIAAFAFVMVKENNAAHLTTIGVAPEHRRRGLADSLLVHIERALVTRGVNTIMLEVRVSNDAAHGLYCRRGFTVVQRIKKYYNNGEDCFLMMKPIGLDC